MNRSTDRILTTHCGSLARPTGLLDMMRARVLGEPCDPGAYDRAVRSAVADCVRAQVAAGLDSVSDGEQGKIGHGLYVRERLTGFDTLPDRPDTLSSQFRAEQESFPEYYDEYFGTAMLGGMVAPLNPVTCTGEVTYRGQDALATDLANLADAVTGVADRWSGEVFMPAVAPSGVADNEYYASEEDYLSALADALATEYEAIAAAGFVLQVDDPWMSTIYSDALLSAADKRNRAQLYVDAINRAVRNIPEERVRFHTCYGINNGPRVHDASLADIIDLVLQVKAGAISFEAANPRHEHEYHLWESAALPEGRILIPGVITHASNIVEHPELIAERIVRFADRVGRENVIAGADCGFASQASYRPEVHPSVVWAKFDALREGARIATQRLW